MDRLHVERMAQDKKNALLGAEVGQPVPGEDAFDANHQVLPVGCNSLEKGLRCCLHIPMQKGLSILIQDADVHGPGMQVKATVEFVLFDVKSHHEAASVGMSDAGRAGAMKDELQTAPV
jgi:hypothetical protein